MYSYSKLKGLSLETRFTKKYKDVTDFNFLQTLTKWGKYKQEENTK